MPSPCLLKNDSLGVKQQPIIHIDYHNLWGHRGRDHMLVGFITAYIISAYHH
jgi:hypothetical protein